MECPTCKAPFQPGDRFCGTCGERLPEVGSVPAPAGRAAASMADPRGGGPFGGQAPAAGPGAGPSGTFPCPTCGAPQTPHTPKCQVCGMEFMAASPGAGMPGGGPSARGGGPFGGGAPPAQQGGRPFSGAPGQAAGGPFGGGAVEQQAGGPFGQSSVPPQGGAPAGGFGGAARQAGPPMGEYDSGMPSAPPRAGAAICPIHGEMDPTWTRCPHCLKEGRDGRLSTPSGGVPRPPTQMGGALAGGPPAAQPPAADRMHDPSALDSGPTIPSRLGSPPAFGGGGPAPAALPSEPPPAPRPVEPPAAAPPRVAEQPVVASVEPSAYRYQAPAEAAPPARSAQLPSPPAQPVQPPAPPDRPKSSVGQTFVIRRRPRVLAYLIEKEGEQVGRVFQLEDDVTDIGRDPRNHVVVNDVMVSGFHARVERGPDGSFVLIDRGSTNGSRINGQPLTQPRIIDENDEVGVGNTSLVLKVVT